MIVPFCRHFLLITGVVQTACVNFVMSVLVVMQKTLLVLILHCILVLSARRSVCDLNTFSMVISNVKFFFNQIFVIVYYNIVMVTLAFEC
jgi:hypothetical protein